MEEILKQKAKEAIDSYSDELYGLSKRIWEKPELNFQEKYAHDQLTEYLAARGFDVTPRIPLFELKPVKMEALQLVWFVNTTLYQKWVTRVDTIWSLNLV